MEDKRPMNRGIEWSYSDDNRPWWYLVFHRMPTEGPWPLRTNSGGCPKAHLLRLLDPYSGTSVLALPPKVKDGREAAAACTAAVGDDIGGYNGTHCVRCRECHFFDGKGCQTCTRCSATSGTGINLHLANCTKTRDTQCLAHPSSPFHLGLSSPDLINRQKCGWENLGLDGGPGICDRKSNLPCCAGVCSNGFFDCTCDGCVNFRSIPWQNNGQCNLQAKPPILCNPFGTAPCCVNGKCVARREKADWENPTNRPRWANERCFTPQRYLEIARREFLPVWESPPTEEEIYWSPSFSPEAPVAPYEELTPYLTRYKGDYKAAAAQLREDGAAAWAIELEAARPREREDLAGF